MLPQKKKGKTAYLSVVALLLCFSMFLGTTFAWFTDSVTSQRNVIQTGRLEVEMKYSHDFAAWSTVDSQTQVFSETLWEPGKVEVSYFEISNAGNLALQYSLSLLLNSEKPGTNQKNESYHLSDYIRVALVDDVSARYPTREDALSVAEALGRGISQEGALVGSLLPGEKKTVAVILSMPESVGNVANALSPDRAGEIYFGVHLKATQLSWESDSFGPDYDLSAGFRLDLDYAPTTDGSGLVVVGIGTWTDSVVRIPAKVNGLPVIGISSSAFNHLMWLTKVELPETLYHIEGGAFRGSERLRSITPASEAYFKSENNVLYSQDGTRLVWAPKLSGEFTVPDSVKTIASYAFADQTDLTRVVVPNGLSAVGVGAFDGCSSLRFNEYQNGFYIGNDTNPYVALIRLNPSSTQLNPHPDNRVIADDALSNCPNLGTVTFPTGVTVIDRWMLAGSPNVTVITVPISVNVIGEAAFAGLEKLETVIIPDSVTRIEDGAFEGCTSLKQITVSQNTALGENVFKGCTSLEQAVISQSSVPAGTFSGCTQLQEVTGLGELTSVGEGAFAGCVELKGDLYIDQSAAVGKDAFAGCTDPDLNIFVESDTAQLPSTWDPQWNGGSTVRLHYYKGYTHDKANHWFACLESGCGVTSQPAAHHFDYADDYRCEECGRQAAVANQSEGLAIQNGVVVGKGSCIESTVYINMPIGENAFLNDNTTETVVLSSGVTSIGKNAFGADSDLGKLKHAVFHSADPSSLSVADGLFLNHRNSGFTVFVPLSAVDAYKNLGTAGGDWQTKVAPLIVGCDPAVLDSLSSMYACTDSSTFKVSGNVIEGFSTNSARAPYRDSVPDNLVIPTFVNGKLITEIKNRNYDQYDYAFGALNLNTLVIAGGITQMNAIFDDCNINTVIIGDCVTVLNTDSFSSSYIETLVLGKSVKTVKDMAFWNSTVGKVFYRGTPEDWNNITIDDGQYNKNAGLKNATRYYYSETDPNGVIPGYSGNYWHYNANGEIEIWAQK